MDHLIGGIRAETIEAIGTVSPDLFSLQYLYTLKLHCDLSGTPVTIIGNCSKKIGEFTMIKIDVASLHDFPYFKKKKMMDINLIQGGIMYHPYRLAQHQNRFKDEFDGA